jgi:hypothetical protein
VDEDMQFSGVTSQKCDVLFVPFSAKNGELFFFLHVVKTWTSGCVTPLFLCLGTGLAVSYQFHTPAAFPSE